MGDLFPAGQNPAESVVKQLEVCVSRALYLVERLSGRLSEGDPSEEIVRELGSCVEEAVRLRAALGELVPDLVREKLSRLLDRCRTAGAAGQAWMDGVAAPRLESLARGHQMHRAYRQSRGTP